MKIGICDDQEEQILNIKNFLEEYFYGQDKKCDIIAYKPGEVI